MFSRLLNQSTFRKTHSHTVIETTHLSLTCTLLHQSVTLSLFLPPTQCRSALSLMYNFTKQQMDRQTTASLHHSMEVWVAMETFDRQLPQRDQE